MSESAALTPREKFRLAKLRAKRSQRGLTLVELSELARLREREAKS